MIIIKTAFLTLFAFIFMHLSYASAAAEQYSRNKAIADNAAKVSAEVLHNAKREAVPDYRSVSWPDTHSSSAVSITINNSDDSFKIYVWRELGLTWIELIPLSDAPFVCGAGFSFLQDSIKYETLKIETIAGNSQCGDISEAAVYMLTNWSFYDEVPDLEQRFTLNFHGGTLQSLLVPASDEDLAGKPQPEILANGTARSLDIDEGDHLTIAISMETNASTAAADWWALSYNAQGEWSYFSPDEGWVNFENIDIDENAVVNLKPAYQGQLVSFENLPLVKTSSLLPGTSSYFFAVDTVMDGHLQLDNSLFFDNVEVTVNLVPEPTPAPTLNPGDCDLSCSPGSVSSTCVTGYSTCQSSFSYDQWGNRISETKNCSYDNGYELSIIFYSSSTTASDNQGGSCAFP